MTRTRHVRIGRGDVALVAVLAVPLLMDAWWSEPGTRSADGLTFGLVAATLISLLVRRAWPISVALICGGSLTALTLVGHTGELLVLPALIALYEIAKQGGRRRTTVTAIVASAWLGVLGWLSLDPLGAPGGSPVLELLLPLVPLALGDAARTRRELVVQTRAATEAQARGRIADERAQMAREVHDVVGHTLAGVTIQLAAAEAAFDVDRASARAALARARASATQAMAALRSTVAGLRAEPDTAPLPGLADLDDLLDPPRRAGVRVHVDDRLPPGDVVPPTPSLVAYRVIQESLTNVVRHADARNVWTVLEVKDDQLHITVEDDGQGRIDGPFPSHPAGFGLRGMAERVHAAGGLLTLGERPGGGFAVSAVLPLTGRVRAASRS